MWVTEFRVGKTRGMQPKYSEIMVHLTNPQRAGSDTIQGNHKVWVKGASYLMNEG